jgi:hypothetical protein
MILKAQQVTQITLALFRSDRGYTFHPDTRISVFRQEATGRVFNCKSDVLVNDEADVLKGEVRLKKLYLLWPTEPCWSDGSPLSQEEIETLKEFAVMTGKLENSAIENHRE